MEIQYNSCSICGFDLKHFSRSADPVAPGKRCCLKCFNYTVVPARKAKIKEWEIEENLKVTDFKEIKVESECPTGKICYKKKEDAEYALYTAGYLRQHGYENRREKLVYFCKLCNQFHLSSHDKLPSWRDRNLPTNYNCKRPLKYTPEARQENW